MKKKRNRWCFRRPDLEIGELYFIHQTINRKLPSDSITIWKHGPQMLAVLDDPIGMVYFNEFNPFVILEITQDPFIDSTFWYKILTKRGAVGHIFLDDTDMEVLHLWFKKPRIKSNE